MKEDPDCVNCPTPCGQFERACPDGTEPLDPGAEALDAIVSEREYQKTRWQPEHDKRHTPEDWHIILSAWMGKLANETPLFQGEAFYDKQKFLKRLAQLGAVAAAAYEALTSSPES